MMSELEKIGGGKENNALVEQLKYRIQIKNEQITKLQREIQLGKSEI